MGLRLPERLPQLSGWVLALYRFGWPILFMVALYSVFYASPTATNRNTPLNRLVFQSGLEPLGSYENGLQVAPFSTEARAAGVRDNDVLVGIDGRPAPTGLVAVADRLGGADGTPVDVTVRGSDGSNRTVTLHRNRTYLDRVYARVGLTYEGRRFALLAMFLVSSALALIVSAMLFLRRKRDAVAALFAIGSALSAISIGSVTQGWASPVMQELLLRVAFGATYLAIGIATFAFPSGRFTPKSTWAGIAALIAFSVLAQLGFDNPRFDTLGYGTLLLMMILLIITIIHRYRRETEAVARQQMKFGMLGIALMAFFFFLGGLVPIISRSVSDQGTIAWLGLARLTANNLGGIVLYLGLLVSLLRFRLYDAETAISRSAVVGALTLFLGFIFAASEKLLENAGESYLGPQSQGTAAALSAVIAATLIAPVHHRLSRWAQRRFQKNLIALREDLPRLVGDLRETASAEQLAAIALDRAERGVRSSRGGILLGNRLLAVHNVRKPEVAEWRKTNRLDPAAGGVIRNSDDPLFPVRVALEADGCGHVGWLLLGPRPDGTLFGKDESEVLAALADPLARALAIAAAREGKDRRAKREFSALRGLVTTLQQRVDRIGVGTA